MPARLRAFQLESNGRERKRTSRSLPRDEQRIQAQAAILRSRSAKRCHEGSGGVGADNATCQFAGLFMGGTGLEPVTPSLSTRSGRSPQFAGVRSGRMVERNPSGERTVERTRANAECCHCCHAASNRFGWYPRTEARVRELRRG
jgi:hypothetical protein